MACKSSVPVILPFTTASEFARFIFGITDCHGVSNRKQGLPDVGRDVVDATTEAEKTPAG